MSEEMRVSIKSDQGIKNQWARGLFYRKDGNKSTLVPKHMIVAGGTVFAVVAIALLIEDPGNNAKAPAQSGFNPTSGDVTGTTVDIPPAISQLRVAAQAKSEGGTTTEPTRTRRGSSSATSSEPKASPFKGPQVVSRPNSGLIPPGSWVKATLQSGASNGPVRAEVSEAFTVNGETVIEEGTLLLGDGSSGEDRLSIRFGQLVRKDGSFNSINATACDWGDKIAGIKGSKIGSQAIKLGMSMGLNFAGGLSEALQDASGESGAVIRKPTLRNALLNGAATAALEQSRELMSDAKNKVPVIEVSSGTPIYVLFQGN